MVGFPDLISQGTDVDNCNQGRTKRGEGIVIHRGKGIVINPFISEDHLTPPFLLSFIYLSIFAF